MNTELEELLLRDEELRDIWDRNNIVHSHFDCMNHNPDVPLKFGLVGLIKTLAKTNTKLMDELIRMKQMFGEPK